jgi:hypothetical protein
MTPEERVELERLRALERRLGEILGRPVPDARALDWTAFARAAEAQAVVADRHRITAIYAAVAEEREACAAVVRSAREDPGREEYADWVNGILTGVEAAIRARGEGTQ